MAFLNMFPDFQRLYNSSFKGFKSHHSSSSRRSDGCESPDPANTLTDRLNTLLSSSGPGYTLSLCPGKQYLIQSPLLFAAPQQEISTVGYPTDDSRATLVVNGPVSNGQGHTTAVDGTCSNCSGVRLRNIQIDGTRGDASPTTGGANIEMGGPNAGQLVEYVHSYDPRSWSCLHIAEGGLNCNNATVQYNDIGPCGRDTFQEWADGISVSCRNSRVHSNMVSGPTDGGIVIFGSPGTVVENNTIRAETHTLLGGINMVDYDPFNGDYTGTVVRNNTILGGFSDEQEGPDASKGTNSDDVIIKIGIAIGPRTWFGDKYGTSVSRSGTVSGNRLSGAFSYAIAVSSATNFTIQDNTLFGNTAFIGGKGPNCSTSDTTPNPSPFVMDGTTASSSTQADFQTVPDADSLTCVLPPDGGDYWPYGGNPTSSSQSSTPSAASSHTGSKAGVAIGIIVGLAAISAVAWYIRRWALRRAEAQRLYTISQSQYHQVT